MATLKDSIVSGLVDKVPLVGGALSGALSGYHQDNLFIRYRDNAMSALESSGFPKSDWSADFGSFKLGHKDIPDRKFGTNYAPEFARLANFVQTYLNKKKPGLGDLFKTINDRLASQLPPDERYKGNPAEAIKQAVSQYSTMNITEIMNQVDGLGIGQAFVQDGKIVVPSTQSGEGIFSSLNNYAATQLTQTIKNAGSMAGQILSQPAAGVSGQQQLAAGGGVVLTGGVNVGGSVTKNTTSNGSTSTGSGTGILIAIVVFVFLLMTGQLKKIFG
jgi:hypothetical protein